MKALVIGGTGAVGSCLLRELLEDERYDSVLSFVRRPSGLVHHKLEEQVVDFDDMYDWGSLLQGDVLFSAMGTSLKKAGSKDAQWKVDYDYQYNVARMAAYNGVKNYALVSSVGASPDSSFFYLSMKGFLEEAVKQLEFERIVIARPATLIRPEPKWVESVSQAVLRIVNRVGLGKSQEPISVTTVAHALIEEMTAGVEIGASKEGVAILSNRYMLDTYSVE